MQNYIKLKVLHTRAAQYHIESSKVLPLAMVFFPPRSNSCNPIVTPYTEQIIKSDANQRSSHLNSVEADRRGAESSARSKIIQRTLPRKQSIRRIV